MKRFAQYLVPLWYFLAKNFAGIFYLLLVIFLVAYLRNIDWAELSKATLVWYYIVGASFLALLTRYWGAFIWLVILKGLGATGLKKHLSELIYVYAKSWLGRYIPGTAPWILGKIYFASKHGIPKHKLGVSSLLEAALQVIVIIALSVALLIFDQRLDVIDLKTKLFMIVVMLGCVLFLIPSVFNYFISKVYFTVKKKTLESKHLATKSVIFNGSALYLVGAFLNGLSFFFLAKAIYPELGYENALFVVGAANLAGAIGILAVFVPSGIGVREAILVLLFSLIMPPELAVLITIVSRLWSIVIDFVFFGVSGLIKKQAVY